MVVTLSGYPVIFRDFWQPNLRTKPDPLNLNVWLTFTLCSLCSQAPRTCLVQQPWISCCPVTHMGLITAVTLSAFLILPGSSSKASMLHTIIHQILGQFSPSLSVTVICQMLGQFSLILSVCHCHPSNAGSVLSRFVCLSSNARLVLSCLSVTIIHQKLGQFSLCHYHPSNARSVLSLVVCLSLSSIKC